MVNLVSNMHRCNIGWPNNKEIKYTTERVVLCFSPSHWTLVTLFLEFYLIILEKVIYFTIQRQSLFI